MFLAISFFFFFVVFLQNIVTAWRNRAASRVFLTILRLYTVSFFQDDNPEDCPVCLTVYDNALRRPRTMPCGHSLCSLCIDGLRYQGHVTCPSCRIRHAMPEGSQFPVSYTLEALVKKLDLTKAEESVATTSMPPRDLRGQCGERGSSQMEATDLPPSMRLLLREQEAKTLSAINTCQEVHAQLREYRTTLADWCEQQQLLENDLQKVIDESRSARILVRQDESRAAAKEEETEERERQLHAALEALRSATSAHEALPAIAHASQSTDEAEQRAGEYREMFPDTTAAAAARKVSVTQPVHRQSISRCTLDSNRQRQEDD